MSLQYILDGYNIVNNPLFARLQISEKDPRRALLEFIRSKKAKQSPRNKFIVVFDGYPVSPCVKQNYADINIIFSKEKTADEAIKITVEQAANPKNTAVISDDREIKFFVKSVGAKSVSVEEFINPPTLRRLPKGAADALKPDLNYTQIDKINKELKKLWLE